MTSLGAWAMSVERVWWSASSLCKTRHVPEFTVFAVLFCHNIRHCMNFALSNQSTHVNNCSCLTRNIHTNITDRRILRKKWLGLYTHQQCCYLQLFFFQQTTVVTIDIMYRHIQTSDKLYCSKVGITLHRIGLLYVKLGLYTGWPKNVSHYRESSLNRIKNRQPG